MTNGKHAVTAVPTEDGDTKQTDDETMKQAKDNGNDDASIDAALDAERGKLHEILNKHKRKMKLIIMVCNAIDLVLAAMLVLPPTKQNTANAPFSPLLDPFSILSRILDTTHDTLDSGIVIILRVLCLWKFIQLSIKWGHPNTHEKIQSNTEAKQEFEKSGIYKLGKAIAWCIDTVVASSGHRRDTTRSPKSAPKAKRRNLMDATEDEQISTFETSQISNDSDGDPQGNAEFWKHTIWVLLFSAMSVFQAHIGVKVVFFQRSSSYYVGIYLMSILVSHLEVYYSKQYIGDCTEPDDKYMDASIHDHPIFKRDVAAAWCSLCWEHIVDIGYRCHKCDFNVCPKCWKNKEKARLAATNQIRNDSTQDNASLAELDKEVTLREYFTRMLEYHSPYKKWFALGLSVLFCKSAISVYVSSAKGSLFDDMVNKDLSAFYRGVEFYIVLSVLKVVLTAIESFILGRIDKSIINDLQTNLFHKTMSQDMVFYDGSLIDSLIERCSWGLSDIVDPFRSAVKTGITSSTNIVGGIFMCWTISYRLTLLGLSTLGPIAYLAMLIRHWYLDSSRVSRRFRVELRRVTDESLTNIKTVRSFSKEPSVIKHYKSLRKGSFANDMKSSAIRSVGQTVTNWFSLAGSTLITWAGGVIVFLSLMDDKNDETLDNDSFWLNDSLTLGSLMAFELYWNRFKQDITGLQQLVEDLAEAKFTAKQIFRTLDAKPSIELIDYDKYDEHENKKCEDIVGDICFDNVHFTYQLEPNKEILKGLNLKIPKGKTTAFVGRSGGGKTTIISMLLRLYDPNDGSITINDTETGQVIDDIRNYNVYSWRNMVGLVSQDTELFGSQTLANNIGFGKDNYTKRELFYASSLANAHEFIMSFDDKYDARIGDRGSKLSGGQKQRLSIARMLMKRPQLMLLDEATSALDAESEAIVQAALEHAMQDTQCTVILVAHRLSTVVNADQICVIDDGNVAECGTHDELLEANGVYAKLVDRQVNLRKTMKDKVKSMAKQKEARDSDSDSTGNASNSDKGTDIDSIDALIDEISKGEQKEKDCKTVCE